MSDKKSLLQRAIEQVDTEHVHVRMERDAFEMFREQVRLTTPDSEDDDVNRTWTSDDLLETYFHEVMEPLDFEAIYGDTLTENLKAEFTSGVADMLLAGKPFTHRRKRNLLVAVTESIESREQFLATLDAERETLKHFANNLDDIDTTLLSIPHCSPQRQSIEDLLKAWEAYDALVERSERLLLRRQQLIRYTDHHLRIRGHTHALYEYLYDNLGTTYPVLSAIANRIRRIKKKQQDWTKPEESDQTIGY